MIYLTLFLTFLKVGAVSFGGGYGMISLIEEECLSQGWLTKDELMNFIAVAESTPGPIAVNLATFVGSSQAGILGSLFATLGIVLPAFLIILLVAALFKNLMKYAGVKAALEGVRPAVVGLILATALTMALGSFFGVESGGDPVSVRVGEITIMLFLGIVAFFYKKFQKKTFSPIFLILISGILGIVLF